MKVLNIADQFLVFYYDSFIKNTVYMSAERPRLMQITQRPAWRQFAQTQPKRVGSDCNHNHTSFRLEKVRYFTFNRKPKIDIWSSPKR